MRTFIRLGILAVAYTGICGGITHAQGGISAYPVTGGAGITPATFASAPPSPISGHPYLFSDAGATGTCSGGGTSYSICVWNGATWGAIAGTSTGLGDPGSNGVVYRNGSGTSIPAMVDKLFAPAICVSAGGTDTYACNLSPVISAYVTRTLYWFQSDVANTGAATINFNSKGALTIKKMRGAVTTDLDDNDIRANQIVGCVYDGTNCQMATQLGTALDGSVIDTDSTMAANSDAKLASQKAVKTALGLKEVALTFGAGLNRSTNTITTDSSAQNFLKAGALTCGSATAGKMQIHTTALQYCDNAGTPALRYAAYGDSSGNASNALLLAGFFTVAGLSSSTKTHTWPNQSIDFTALSGVGKWTAGVPSAATSDTDYAAVPADCPSVTFSSNVATYPSLASCNTILVSPSSGANVTSVGTGPSNGVKDKFYVVVFTQPSPTAVTNVWPSSFVNAPTVAAEASSVTRFVVQYDGVSTFQYLAATNTSGHGVSSEASAPGANPASGIIYPYFSSVTHRFETLNSAGNTFGGVQDKAAVSNNYATSIVNGVLVLARPTCANLSDSSGGCTMSTTISGDAIGTLPAITLATVNANTGACGDATHVCQVTLDGKGRATAASAVAITGGGYATIDSNGSAVTQRNIVNFISGSNAMVTCVDNSGSTRTDCTVAATAGSAAPTFPVNAQTSTYQLLAADFTNFKTISVASGTFTITAVASGSQPASGTGVLVVNYGSGVVTVARSGQNINGAAANLTIAAGSASAPNGMFVVSDGTNYIAQPLIGAASGSGITALTGDVTASGTGSVAATIAANAVTSPKMAVVNTRVTKCITVGANNGPVLADADLGPQSRQVFIPYAATAVEIEVAGDGGTPNVILGKSHAGSITNLTSSALATASAGGIACSNSGGTTGIDGATTCSSTIQNTSFAAGDWITLVSGTAGGTAKEMTACVTMTIN